MSEGGLGVEDLLLKGVEGESIITFEEVGACRVEDASKPFGSTAGSLAMKRQMKTKKV